MPPSDSGQDLVNRFTKSWAETFVTAAHECNFKNGSFKDKITESTSALESVVILLESHLLTKDEKNMVAKVGQAIRCAQYLGPNMTTEDAIKLGSMCIDVIEIFQEDQRKQGRYVQSGIMVYALDEDNKVAKTFEVSDKGIKETAGGKMGRVPGAPEEFNKQYEVDWETLAANKEGEDVKMSARKKHFLLVNPPNDAEQKQEGSSNHQDSQDAAEDVDAPKTKTADVDAPKTAAEDVDAPKTKTEDVNAPKTKTEAGFGSDFKKNIRGAFL